METVEPELIDVAPGLWLWQVQYQEWPRDEGAVASACWCIRASMACPVCQPSLSTPAAKTNNQQEFKRFGASPPKHRKAAWCGFAIGLRSNLGQFL
jgi:hypothetical protein